MSEWILLLYPIVLFACLMLAARLQPKDSPSELDESETHAFRRRISDR